MNCPHGPAALLATALLSMAPVHAQEFGLYLACKGTVEAKGRALAAHLDLALRRNNQTALVQRSDVLPVGERFRFETSPTHYSMVLRAPARGSVVYYDWLRGALVVWDPDLQRMHAARISVDAFTTGLVLGQFGPHEGAELLRRGRRRLGHQRWPARLHLGRGQGVDKGLVQPRGQVSAGSRAGPNRPNQVWMSKPPGRGRAGSATVGRSGMALARGGGHRQRLELAAADVGRRRGQVVEVEVDLARQQRQLRRRPPA
jgi:hypothetical protein